MKKINFKNYAIVLAIGLSMISCVSRDDNPQRDTGNSPSETAVGQTTSEPKTTPPKPPRTNTGETLYVGTINTKYENPGYEYKGVDVVDISFEKFTVSFVLSENKDKIRDIKIEVGGFKFIVGRDGKGQQVDISTTVGFGDRTWDISITGKNNIDFPDKGFGSKPGMVLQFDGDTATAGIYYEYDFTWQNIQVPIVLGSHNIIFTTQSEKPNE